MQNQVNDKNSRPLYLTALTTKHQLESYQKLLAAGCIEDNVDYTGNDITTTRAYSAKECQRQCKNNSICRFWTWVKPEFGTSAACFLKDHIKERKTNYKTTSGLGDCSGNKYKFFSLKFSNFCLNQHLFNWERVRTTKIRTWKVKVRFGQVWFGWVRLGYVMLSQGRLSQVKSGQKVY